jgi:hypothetical protein
MNKFIIICLFLLLIPIVGFSKHTTFKSVKVDQWFDYYGDITWQEEKAHLINFALYLRQNPDEVGYIAFHIGKKDKSKEVKSRIKKAKKYLISELKIKENRIITVDAGRAEETIIILQPVSKNMSPPDF